MFSDWTQAFDFIEETSTFCGRKTLYLQRDSAELLTARRSIGHKHLILLKKLSTFCGVIWLLETALSPASYRLNWLQFDCKVRRAALTAHFGKFVAYYRMSTDKQGQSGLGLDAQHPAVMTYLNGGPWKLIAEFTEVETGKRADRPELQKALAACRKHKAKLIIAKLDRLSRNLAFIAADNPHANRLTVHILAAVAEHERAAISERTKAALAAAKRRGVKGP